jgi:hypothetical protein
MNGAGRSLKELHRDIIVRLAAALGNLRLLAIGAPFASELVKLAENEVEAALLSAQDAEALRAEICGALTAPEVAGSER